MTTNKRTMKAETEILRARVSRLLGAHTMGSVDAGNEAFKIADALTKKLTAAASFNELLDDADHGYRPTLRGGGETAILADLYDYAQALRGRDVQAYRGVGV